jgi:hypothetical protein
MIGELLTEGYDLMNNSPSSGQQRFSQFWLQRENGTWAIVPETDVSSTSLFKARMKCSDAASEALR